MAVVIWNAGAPPKRGAYRVKSDGPSPNAGYRYWNGERWSPWSRSHKSASSWGKHGNHRKTTTRYPILWASKAPSAASCCPTCGMPTTAAHAATKTED